MFAHVMPITEKKNRTDLRDVEKWIDGSPTFEWIVLFVDDRISSTKRMRVVGERTGPWEMLLLIGKGGEVNQSTMMEVDWPERKLDKKQQSEGENPKEGSTGDHTLISHLCIHGLWLLSMQECWDYHTSEHTHLCPYRHGSFLSHNPKYPKL